MLSIICGTNRPNSKSSKVASHYLNNILSKNETPAQLLLLENVPFQFEVSPFLQQPAAIAQLQDQYLINAEKWIFVCPEYNGSFPGAFKYFLDICSLRDLKKTFGDKKICLVGVASGRSGNIRGMDHLTGMLHYLGAHILPNKLPISQIHKLMDENGELSDAATLEAIDNQINSFLAY